MTPPNGYTRIEYHSALDAWGKCTFTLYWMADYHPGDPAGEHRRAERGQVFHADPEDYGFPMLSQKLRRAGVL